MTMHQPLLLNLLGHAAGTLIFGLFCAFLFRGRAPVARLPLAAGALALLWNVGSLVVFGAGITWMAAVATSSLSMLPAVLLHISLGGRLRGIIYAGYTLSGIAVVLHCAEPLLAAPNLHRQTLALTAYGFAALTIVSGFASRARLAAMALLVFALSFVHFHEAGAQPHWSLELLVHHAGIPLALFILLQDYRFVLLDAFVRVLTNILLAGLFTFGAAQLASWTGWLNPVLADPRRQALAAVIACTFLVLFALARSSAQRLLTWAWFRREDLDEVIERLRDGARHQPDADSYLEWAMDEMVRSMHAERAEPAEVQIPIRLSPDDTRLLGLGRRLGGRRYLSEDLNALERWAAVVAAEWNAYREAELRQLMSQAELKALQAQIHPHFLFNALNTVYGVIPKEAAGARRTVLNLADIFRYFLRTDRGFIPLESELEIIQAYLEIEQLRLGRKLRTSIEASAEARRAQIPVLSVEPLVENAVKHGIAARAEGGEVRLTAELTGGQLEVAVFDSGPGFDPKANGGVGLENVRRRLRLCYGPGADIAVRSTPDGTTVSFRVPQTVPA